MVIKDDQRELEISISENGSGVSMYVKTIKTNNEDNNKVIDTSLRITFSLVEAQQIIAGMKIVMRNVVDEC